MNSSPQWTLAGQCVRRFVLTAAVAVAGAGALLVTSNPTSAYAQAASAAEGHGWGHRGCSHHEGHDPALGPLEDNRMLKHMLDDVKATDAQRAKINQIAEAARKDVKAQLDAGRGLHEKSVQILSAPQIDDAAAESVRQQLLAVHDKVSKRTLQAMLDISRVLTPEQRARVARHIKEHKDHDRPDGNPDARSNKPDQLPPQ